MGRYPHRAAWQRETAADAVAIAEAMERCGVSAFADRFVGTLSGGERQRVRLARALAQQTDIVVLDEPTSALDIRYEMEVFEQVAALRRAGKTAVLVTHQLNLAARYADQLVLLHAGRIVAHGTPHDVLTAARVEAVYEWPVHIIAHREGAPQIVPERPTTPWTVA
jgi:iron complex transport system ATP-binding protein